MKPPLVEVSATVGAAPLSILPVAAIVFFWISWPNGLVITLPLEKTAKGDSTDEDAAAKDPNVKEGAPGPEPKTGTLDPEPKNGEGAVAASSNAV